MSNSGNLLLFSLGWVKALISEWQLQPIGVLHTQQMGAPLEATLGTYVLEQEEPPCKERET